MSLLSEFLAADASRPMIWGEHDCGLRLADWYSFATGKPDPAKHLRGTYASEKECESRFGTVASLKQARAITKRLGLERTKTPETGDVGILAIRHAERRWAVGGICVGDAWTILGSQGLTRLPSAGVRTVAAWRIPQHATDRSR